jgi:hypothetical protein
LNGASRNDLARSAVSSKGRGAEAYAEGGEEAMKWEYRVVTSQSNTLEQELNRLALRNGK